MPDNFIPLSIPNLGDAEREGMDQCIRSGWVSTASPQVGAFEKEVAHFTGAEHAVAVSSGSAALFLALKQLGLRKNDIVLIPSLTFIATANAAFHLGAKIILVDSDPLTWQMDSQLAGNFFRDECELREGSLYHRESGNRVWGFVPVHANGYPGEINTWNNLAEKYSLKWVEDAAAALGSFRNGIHSGLTADAGILSFNGNKILTTGGGGMVITKNFNLAQSILHISTHAYADNRKGGYLHDANGHNLRLTGLAAALGLAQLNRMPEFLSQKNFIHEFYLDAFSNLSEICPFRNPDPEITKPNHWLFALSTKNAEELKAYLESKGIESRKLWVPLNQLAIFKSCRFLSEKNHSEKIYSQALWLPSSTGISQSQLEQVVKTIKYFFVK